MQTPVFLLGKQVNWWKVAGIALLFLWGVDGFFHPMAFFLLKEADLFIHEIGHGLFGSLGNENLMLLGGSLFQLLVPLGVTAYFMVTKQYFSGAVGVFWVAVNLFDVAIYMADARALQLPLATFAADADEVLHDWNTLFDRWGVLMYDTQIAAVVNIVGWLVMIAALLLGLWFAWERPKLAEGEEHPIPELANLEEPLHAPTPPPPAPPRPRKPVVVTDYLQGAKGKRPDE